MLNQHLIALVAPLIIYFGTALPPKICKLPKMENKPKITLTINFKNPKIFIEKENRIEIVPGKSNWQIAQDKEKIKLAKKIKKQSVNSSNYNLIVAEIAKYDWDIKTAIAIAKAESGLRNEATGDTNTKYPSVGIFQIRLLPGRPSEIQLRDYKFNISYAYQMYKNSGWKPWSAWLNKSYILYMN